MQKNIGRWRVFIIGVFLMAMLANPSFAQSPSQVFLYHPDAAAQEIDELRSRLGVAEDALEAELKDAQLEGLYLRVRERGNLQILSLRRTVTDPLRLRPLFERAGAQGIQVRLAPKEGMEAQDALLALAQGLELLGRPLEENKLDLALEQSQLQEAQPGLSDFLSRLEEDVARVSEMRARPLSSTEIDELFESLTERYPAFASLQGTIVSWVERAQSEFSGEEDSFLGNIQSWINRALEARWIQSIRHFLEDIQERIIEWNRGKNGLERT